MCNPRRIRVRATRDLCEAWEREVARTIALQETIRGEARIRQPLDATLGGPTLRTLEAVMGTPGSGWTEVSPGCYRHEVEGGYVTYVAEDRALEIVAYLEDEVQTEHEERQRLQGQLDVQIEAEGEGRYYDDEYGGRTAKDARRDAEAAAAQRLEEERRTRLETVGREAEEQISAELDARARAAAETQLRRIAEERRAALELQARQHLEAVGLRCRQAFHQALSQAYRDAILAYARLQHAENIQCSESGDIVEIEFSLRG